MGDESAAMRGAEQRAAKVAVGLSARGKWPVGYLSGPGTHVRAGRLRDISLFPEPDGIQTRSCSFLIPLWSILFVQYAHALVAGFGEGFRTKERTVDSVRSGMLQQQVRWARAGSGSMWLS